MKEDLLHYAWRTKQFALTALRTTQGQLLEITDFGQYNRFEGGPDFRECVVRIGNMVWCGSVEMHLAASDWYRHRHDRDSKYNNVVLHVVLEEDSPVFINNHRLPCLEMKGLLDRRLVSRYARLQHLGHWVPCESHLKDVPDELKILWLERMLVERLEHKVGNRGLNGSATVDDWKLLLKRLLGRAFGFKVNAEPMERLVESVARLDRGTWKGDPSTYEALYLGMAGMLNRLFTDAYPVELYRQFEEYNRQINMHPLDISIWHKGGVRPANQPVLRIVQLATVMRNFERLFAVITRLASIHEIKGHLRPMLSEYWADHYDIDRKTTKGSRRLGLPSADSVLLNAVIPFLFLYGKHHDLPEFCESALNMLTIIKPESNHITRNWVSSGMPNANAGHSQALLHLKREYCIVTRCLECAIGNQILTKKETNG